MTTEQTPIEWLRSAMVDRGVSQSALARAFDVDPSAIHRLMTGHRQLKISELSVLSEILGMPFDEVAGRFKMTISALKHPPSYPNASIKVGADGVVLKIEQRVTNAQAAKIFAILAGDDD